MKRPNMSPDTDFTGFTSQRATKRARNGQNTVETVKQRSDTATSKGSHHTRSRGSTASIQSCTTQYVPDQHQGPEGYEAFPRSHFGATQPTYNSNPEEMIMRFGEQLANSHPGSLLDPALQENHNSTRPRTDINFAGHGYSAHDDLSRTLQDLTPHGIPGPHPSHYPTLFDGIENQMPDQMIEENEVASEASGPRKKKGTTSSIANDKELRRLLRQYDGYTLQQMAAEVQKHEGAGGKSEKVKQVFAMIWLRENCRKSSGSVRRDRVYSSYAEKCGTERVSVLNPASFGKLVRIIFPNVQTRRLGVRGESKYHYVDLTIVDQNPKPQSGSGEIADNNAANASEKKPTPDIQSSDTCAQEPASGRTSASLPTTPALSGSLNASCRADCQCSSTTPLDSSPLQPFSTRNMEAQQKLRRILLLSRGACPPPAENAPLNLPDIHEYLPTNSDANVAVALTALYRSHCVSVIDSFRFCREKALFRHFSAFQGTLTVPVHKLLVHPDISPWIEDCDWLMYQKMVAFVAPLATQVIPGQVLKAFRNISQKLLPHIAETFKSQPEHVSKARLAPAQVFCHLLTRMLDANQSANAAAAWLCSVENRSQMLEDFQSFVTPVDVVARAQIPMCSAAGVLDILANGTKSLLAPLLNRSTSDVQFIDNAMGYQKFDYTPNNSDDYTEFPDRWISFMLQLPDLFPGHRASCIIDKSEMLWTNILHRLTLGGAQSFSAWWMTKVFFHEMIQWQAELGGFMQSSAKSLRLALANPNSSVNGQPTSANPSNDLKDSSFRSSQQKSSGLADATAIATNGNVQNAPEKESGKNGSSVSQQQTTSARDTDTSINNNTLNHDDSAIDLDDDSMLLTTGKYGDMTASDPADAEGEVVVV
ncbi:hypothetical protein VTO42DRAFT_5638 [Malbranchea cinnamomea]